MATGASDVYTTSSESGSEADRPNRWQGPPTTWQYMNREEINTLTALNEIRNRDLSVHLYNAFALKQRHGTTFATVDGGHDALPVPNKDTDAATGQVIQVDDWLPQRSWTAWPMSRSRVPPDDFMRSSNENDKQFTVRQSPQGEKPSWALEEAIGAAILNFAKEKFESRPLEDDDAAADWEYDDHEENENEDEMLPSDASDDGMTSTSNSMSRSRSRSRSRAKSIKRENASPNKSQRKSEDINIDSENSDSEHESIQLSTRERDLHPVVSADDHLSYNLMRPAIRHILTNLDATLVVLHNSRDAAVNCLSDSSSDTDSENSNAAGQHGRSRSRGSEPPAKRRRGRPARASLALRSREPPPLENSDNTSPKTGRGAGTVKNPEDLAPKSKVGRPKKIYPRLDGETDKEYAIRISRLRKERIPFFADEAADSGNPRSSDSEARPRTQRVSKRKPLKPRDQPSNESVRKKVHLEKKSARFGLRDWKDVLGAAALAGFPQAALDRAARRCADLFGQKMELRTMNEGPLEMGEQDKLVQYHPGMILGLGIESGQEDEDSDEEARSQTNRRIRSNSVVSDGQRGRQRSRSRSRSRTRSRSVSIANSHFCRVRGCSRGTDGFSRRSNLLRHMKLIHDFDEDGLATDVDSEDEMLGAVHVDGFLKPIKMRRGWRGEDIRTDSSSKRRYGGRYRKREIQRNTDGTEDVGNQDVDMADVNTLGRDHN